MRRSDDVRAGGGQYGSLTVRAVRRLATVRPGGVRSLAAPGINRVAAYLSLGWVGIM